MNNIYGIKLPLLEEVFVNHTIRISEGECYFIDKFIMVFHRSIVINPEDTIKYVQSGKEPVYYYLLHALPYLSPYLQRGLEIPVNNQPLFIKSFCSYHTIFNSLQFRLFLSGSIIKAQ